MNDTTLAQQMGVAATRKVTLHEQHDVKRQSGAGVGLAHAAQLSLGQKSIWSYVPYLSSRDNII